MVQTNLANVTETTGIDLSKSAGQMALGTLIEGILPYNQWTYDYSTGVLTLTTDTEVTVNLSSIGVVI